MHICIIFSFLLLTQINWLISKRCCLRLSIVWLFRFFKSSFLHRLWFSFEYIISFLCWEHIKKVSWTFSFRNQKCISWIPIVLDFGRLKRRWRLNWMHWKWYGCCNVLEFQTNKEFWDHFKLKSLNISLKSFAYISIFYSAKHYLIIPFCPSFSWIYVIKIFHQIIKKDYDFRNLFLNYGSTYSKYIL